MDSFLNEFNKLKKNFLLPKFLWYYSFDDVEFDLLENITHKKKVFSSSNWNHNLCDSHKSQFL